MYDVCHVASIMSRKCKLRVKGALALRDLLLLLLRTAHCEERRGFPDVLDHSRQLQDELGDLQVRLQAFWQAPAWPC